MESNPLISRINDNILYLTLNRPGSLNALTINMVTQLTNSFRKAQTNPNIRAIVLSGAGASFCAGADIKSMEKNTPTNVYDQLGKFHECIITMQQLEKPIIASVHGHAAGAGFNLALACGLIVAARDSKFILSFTKMGLTSDCGGSYFLPRIIGPYLSKELFFLAEPMLAERAYELGLVNYLVKPDSLKEHTELLALKLVNFPHKAIGVTKKIINQSFHLKLDDVLENERANQAILVTTEEHHEAVEAFMEKRKPIFNKQPS